MAPRPVTILVCGVRRAACGLRCDISDRYGIPYQAVRERYYRANNRGKNLVKPSQ